MTFEQLLAILDGKKASLYGILVLTLNFMALKGFIDQDTNIYLATSIGIILGVIEYKTPQVLGQRRK